MIEVRPMGNAMQLELLTKVLVVLAVKGRGPTRLAEDGRGDWRDRQACDAEGVCRLLAEEADSG